MIRIIIFALIILMLIIIFFGFIEIGFKINCDGSKIDFNIYLYKFDMTKYIVRKKKHKVSENSDEEMIETKNQKHGADIRASLEILCHILDKIRFLKKKPKMIITNSIEFGLEEADVTAIMYGYISWFLYSILGVLSLYMDIGKSYIDIKPIYNKMVFKLYFRGILKIKIAQIIYISFLFITLGRKLNGSASNRKFNENYS